MKKATDEHGLTRMMLSRGACALGTAMFHSALSSDPPVPAVASTGLPVPLQWGSVFHPCSSVAQILNLTFTGKIVASRVGGVRWGFCSRIS